MDIGKTVELQMRAWNTAGAADRYELLELTCSPDATFTSPDGAVVGTSQLSDQIGQFRRQFPGAVLSAGPVTAHHGYARWDWTTDWNDGRDPLTGEDFAMLAGDGRIARLVTFWHSGGPAG
jgi:hypothetical protein